jgi:DNA invertase Pin-like site-specific DNA recombinase
MATPPGAPKGTAVVRPLILGYVRVTANSDSTDVDRLRRQVADFAEREGFALGEVFVEVEASGSSAFAALIDAALARRADAVVVPALQHFGRLPGVRVAMRELLERRTGVRVVVMHPQLGSTGCCSRHGGVDGTTE